MISQATDARRGRVALLGCGTVGREVASRLLTDPPRAGLTLAKVLVRDAARDRGLPACDRALFTDSFDEALGCEPDVVVELLGGLEPAAAYVEAALARGIPVVTANKTVVAHRGSALLRLARGCGAALRFEGAVCAGLPILAALEQLGGDRIRSIRGIISGSCNFILTRLAAGTSFDAAVREAQGRGLVEPNPEADLSGRDCAEKACILAAAAGFPGLTPDRVDVAGIDRLTPEDLAAARRMGRAIKLLAELEFGPPGTLSAARVGPTLLPLTHPLAGVHDEENGVLVSAALAGDVFLRGRGAGPAPTASAVLGDVVRVLGSGGWDRRCVEGVAERGGPRQGEREHLIRASADPGGLTPAGVLSALDEHGVRAREVGVSRVAAHVLARCDDRAAAACAGAIARGDAARALVVPGLGGGSAPPVSTRVHRTPADRWLYPSVPDPRPQEPRRCPNPTPPPPPPITASPPAPSTPASTPTPPPAP